MILSEFLDMWTRANRVVIICDANTYDEMFDGVDDLNEGKAHIQDFNNFMECGFIPYYTQYRSKYYLHPKYADAEIQNFFIGDCYLIVWVALNDKYQEEVSE